VIKSINDFDTLNFPKIDYIFSIVNSSLLPSSFIKFAQKMAINYHDSLLPNYAGLNATSWALLNDEKLHGITWHLINEKVDAGDILVQHSFPIDKSDTALILNLRCYEQAIISFDELLEKLKSRSYVAKPQLLTHRHYFSATHLLPSLGFINWQTMSAQSILRLHRALVLGHYRNNIGCLKIYLENDFLIVTDVQVMDILCNEKNPGTILNVDLEALQVVTNDGVIRLHVKTPSMKNLVDPIVQYNLLPDVQLPVLPDNFLNLHSKSYHHALKNESFWIRRLQDAAEHKTFSSLTICSERFIQAVKPLKNRQILANNLGKKKLSFYLQGY
jgi:methionyl-tRNA formyltransferase